MDNVTERDPLATRIRVLEEFGKIITQIATNPELWRKLSFEAHKELCKELGEDFMDYPEFEFWFSRFLQGNFNLDYHRSSDPKARSFLDLPWDTFEKVGEYLRLYDRLELRNVCKDVRARVDNWDPKVAKICYYTVKVWSIDHKSRRESYFSQTMEIHDRFNNSNPMSFVMNVLKHPKLQLEELTIYREDQDWKKLIKRLDKSNQKLHVKKVDFAHFYRSSKIDLHFMIPGVLEEIKILFLYPKRNELSEIIESEQCQASRMLHIQSGTCPSEFPLDVLYNCPRFTLRLEGKHEDVYKPNFLKTLMNKGVVQKCVIYMLEPSDITFSPSEILKYFNEPEAMVQDIPSLRRYPIPGTNEFYELEYREEVKSRKGPGFRENLVRLERKHKPHEMAERDQVVTRRRILEEFGKVQMQIAAKPELWRKLSFEAHRELCKVVKWWNFINYPEFEFWFLRFVQGNFDLDYDRSSDPKVRPLSDLPQDVFEKIGETLELHDRFQLRNVCKDFRIQVDNWDPKVTKIYYSSANDWRIWQTSRPALYCADNFGLNENNRFRPGFHRYPISFVMSVLKHPKLQLEKMTIDLQGIMWKKLVKRLDASNRKLHVKNVEFQNRQRRANIDLRFMIPGVLEEIKMFLVDPTREDITEIVKSEQCQAAKLVYIESPIIFSQFPSDVLYNCPRFTLKFGGSPAYRLKAKFLKKLMKEGKVQKCVIYAHCQILKHFNEPEAMVPNFPSLRRYPIPGTNDFYEIEYQEKSIRLERK
ncbi:hypothetical protein GCK72_021061 [Caenorhabditis remanei]|uniref:F-box domain-containing protein n=1 Tax=Caenorhabditis remanei TaxID=31234 RepID=A0A6A5GH35_CAERE|nr:hypothetical protein GCK72_021061 [Caenorhabditis remanei]KAF1754498.1 hypothetical protein GCK72_021061 [Caenorhabditis remanei]